MSARILVVEDESIVQLDLQSRLRRLGHSVVGFASRGEEAIAKAVDLVPDLVLMDVHLQGPMDGMEAAPEFGLNDRYRLSLRPLLQTQLNLLNRNHCNRVCRSHLPHQHYRPRSHRPYCQTRKRDEGLRRTSADTAGATSWRFEDLSWHKHCPLL